MKTEKIFTSLRPFVVDNHNGKIKFCASCGNLATQEALFSFGGGVTVLERYCDICARKVKYRTLFMTSSNNNDDFNMIKTDIPERCNHKLLLGWIITRIKPETIMRSCVYHG